MNDEREIWADFDGFWWVRLKSGELCGPYDTYDEAFNDTE